MGSEELRYNVDLENVFEGPMDLLVHLVKRNDVDIYDIPIALITDQYLEYLEMMKAMNIDIAGDFILMASTLTQIKSKMLLPSDKDEEEDDPRSEISAPLEEYFCIKSLAQILAKRNRLGEDTFVRNVCLKDMSLKPEDKIIKADLFELIDAFQRIINRLSPEHKVEFKAEGISVKKKISEIAEFLEAKGNASFDELFSGNTEKYQIIVTFLALLEMAKVCLIRIVQHVRTGVIRVFYFKD